LKPAADEPNLKPREPGDEGDDEPGTRYQKAKPYSREEEAEYLRNYRPKEIKLKEAHPQPPLRANQRKDV